MIKTWCRYYKRCHAVVHQRTKNAWRKPNGPDFSLRRHRSTFHRFLKMLACFDGLVVTCIFLMYALPVMCSTYKKVKQFFLHTQRRQNVKNLGEAKPIWHPYIIHSGNQPYTKWLTGDQGLKNWTGGTWNIIKLIRMNSRFALIHKKAQEQKLLKNWTILKNLKEKKNQISALFSSQRPPSHRFGS